MDMTGIISIVLAVLCVAIYALHIFIKAKGDLAASASELIAIMEGSGLAGPEKMRLVVSELYKQVPAPLKKILTEDKLTDLAQGVFALMRRYADTYVAAVKSGNTAEERDEAVKESASKLKAEAVSGLISGLYGLGLDALRVKAEETGAKIAPEDSERDIVQAIVAAVLNKA